MKRKKILEAMDLLEDQYIAEATPGEKKSSHRFWIRIGALAACFALLLSFGIWLTIPYDTDLPSIARYEDSEYYPVIERLNVLTYQRPRYKNRWQKLVSTLKNAESKDDMNAGAAPELGMDGSSGSVEDRYQETTDNQVAGVIESDLIKRSDKYIFYMSNGKLLVYDINRENTASVGSFELKAPKDARYFLSHNIEFYLSEDCRTLTYLYTYYTKLNKSVIRIVALDVSDPANISEKSSVTLSGSINASRMVDGKLLLISEFYVGHRPNFADESTFIPQIDNGNGPVSIPIDNIIFPETLTASRYTVVSTLDASTLAFADCTAFLSYSDTAYVSQDSAYVTRTFGQKNTEGDYTKNVTMTEISRLCYAGDTLEYKGSVAVAGSVKDQYSMDEYEGVLRVVTTTSYQVFEESNHVSEALMDSVSLFSNANASLYCIDLDGMKLIAAKENFAPAGESVQSVRFDGTAAYVCTSIQLSDPVFFFDLSDLDHILCKDTGTIDGFSTSLVQLGNGFLLGIGVGSKSDTVKIEIYEESETGVRSVCKYEVENAYASERYKAYYINRSEGLIGLGVTCYNNKDEGGRYILLHFNGYELNELINIALDGSDDHKRAVYVDGYLYMFSHTGFAVKQVIQ